MLATRHIVKDIAPPLLAVRALPPHHKKLTRDGTMLFREAPLSVFGPESRFWASWKKEQRAWLERGYFIAKDASGWRITQWLTVDRELTAVGQDRLDRLVGAVAEPVQVELEVSGELKLEALPHDLESKLFDYQRQPARQLFRALTHGLREWGYPGAADLSDMGTGKTYQGLAAALATGRKVAVLCPTVGRAGWERAFAHFGAEPYFIGTYEAVRGNWRQEIVRLRADGSFEWANANDIILILDEAQALRHDDTLNVKCCAAAVRQCIPIIVASATVAISPLEMRFAGRVTGLHKGERDWDAFRLRHGCGQVGGTWKWSGDLRTLQAIHGKLFPRRGCRVRKEDLGEACPETVIEVMPLDVPEAVEIEREWREAMELFSTLQAQGVDRRAIIARERVARMQVWMRCENALVEQVAAMARREIDEGRNVACFMNFDESRLRLGKLLNTSAGFFGKQNAKMRKHYEAQFQANKIHALVSNMKAGGASVSLHDLTGERPRTAFIFPTDAVIEMVQATGRVDRVGGKSLSRQFIPCVRGTMTERMVERTRRKMLGISTLNDGSGSAKF